MHAVAAHEIDVFFVADAAFGYNGFAAQLRQEVEGLLQGHFKRTQVAVVDAPQRRGHIAAFFQLGRIVQFQQYSHAQFVGNGFKTLKLLGFQCGGNQKNRIRTPRARLDRFGIRR